MPVRFVVLAAALLALALPAPASAQTEGITFSIDLTPAIEGLGLGFLGALDLGVLTTDLITGTTEPRRRAVLVDTEITLGALQLLGAIPAWWSWTRETIPSHRDTALAACVELTAAGAVLLLASVLDYALRDVHVAVLPDRDGAMATMRGRF